MIKILSPSQDLFKLEVDYYVNPVNCLGISGAGLALEFKRRYPFHQKNFELECPLSGGSIYLNAPIIYFPTKYTPADKRSNIELLRVNLHTLAIICGERKITEIGMPALGCGLGKLSFAQVLPLIEEEFLKTSTLVYLIPPK